MSTEVFQSVLTISHGDLLFLSYKPIENGASASASQPAASASTSSAAAPAAETSSGQPLRPSAPRVNLSKVVEPEVDQFWRTQDGKIDRKRDNAFCKHGDKGMCDYCMPLEVSI